MTLFEKFPTKQTEAVQFDGSPEQVDALNQEGIVVREDGGKFYFSSGSSPAELVVGDYITRSPNGTVSTVNPDVFASQYEGVKVEEDTYERQMARVEQEQGPQPESGSQAAPAGVHSTEEQNDIGNQRPTSNND